MYLIKGLDNKNQIMYSLAGFSTATEYSLSPQVILQKTRLTRLSSKRTVEFNLQFITILYDALSINPSLSDSIRELSHHIENNVMRAYFTHLYHLICLGKSLGDALLILPLSIPTEHLRLIQEASASNRLSQCLLTIIRHFKSTIEKGQWIRKKITYPLIIFLFSLFFLHFLVLVLMPNLILLYENVDRTPSTWLSMLSGNVYILLLIDTTLAFLCYFFFYATAPFLKVLRNRLIHLIPWVRRIQYQIARVHWLNHFLLNLDSPTISLTHAWKLATHSCANSALRKTLQSIHLKLKQGQSLNQLVSKAHLLPLSWTLAFCVAQKQAALKSSCTRLYEDEIQSLEHTLSQVFAWIEPILLLIVSAAVLLMIWLFYSPILSIYSHPNQNF